MMASLSASEASGEEEQGVIEMYGVSLLSYARKKCIDGAKRYNSSIDGPKRYSIDGAKRFILRNHPTKRVWPTRLMSDFLFAHLGPESESDSLFFTFDYPTQY
jgi:hypothetical protein